jgi:hypothetical protein
MRVIRVLGIWDLNPGFVYFRDISPVLSLVHVAPKTLIESKHTKYRYILISVISIYLSILSPIRGGGDYRGIYDIGLKGAFMG